MQRFSVSQLSHSTEAPATERPSVNPQPQLPTIKLSAVEVCSEYVGELSYKECHTIEALLLVRKDEARMEAIKAALDLMGPEGSVNFESKKYTLNNDGEIECI